MTKDRFRVLIRKAGLWQKQVAAHLSIFESTIVRWPEDAVPPYAAAYALLMARVPPGPERDVILAEMRRAE